jgi:hypothetical protein
LQECFEGTVFCYATDISPQDCINNSGRPECEVSACREGCLLGDGDFDGDQDLLDFALLQNCFTGPGQSSPNEDCPFAFSANEDGDIDWLDFQEYQGSFNGPAR